jgi:8-oxoguanine DNA glycosylase, N-terminal domain
VLQVSSIVHSLRTLTTVPRSQYSILNEATRSNTQEMVVSQRGSSFNNIIQGAKWIDLQIPASELRPNYTLIMGQCFNWKRIDDSDVDGVISSCWVGILGSHPLAIRQTDDSTYFANLLEIGGSKFAASTVSSVKSENVKSERVKSENGASGTSNAELAQMLHTYFQIDHSLEDLYLDWAKGCDRMKVVTDTLKGVRVVQQDPFECKYL